MLVVAAHRRGMMVMADFVANHCHINNPIVEKNRNWFKRRKDGSFVGLFGIKSLPQFNLDIVGAQNFIIEKGKELCSHGFDAIRLDYAKGPSLTFWKRFKEEIRRLNKSRKPQISDIHHHQTLLRLTAALKYKKYTATMFY